MGNRHAVVSRQSTVSDASLSQQTKFCSSEFSFRLQSTSSSDSEPNNNCKFSYENGDAVLLQSANQRMISIKNRKISRAASAGRIQRRRIIPGLSSTRTDVLSDVLKDVIIDSWQSLLLLHSSDSTLIGLCIYQRVFKAAPELKCVFCVPDEVDVRGYVPAHRSAKLFISVIDLCIRNIYSVEAEMGPVLVMYGRRHYHKPGFRNIYLSVFAKCILDFVTENLDECENLDEIRESWSRLLGYICAKLEEGAELERHRTSSMRRRSVL